MSEGIGWIGDIIRTGKSRATEFPETNTINLLETLVRRYAEFERRTIRDTTEARGLVMVILDYLVEQGSVNAFLLRDQLA